MKPELLTYIDGIVKTHLTIQHEKRLFYFYKRTDKAWQNENKNFKAEIEEEIKLCNEFLNESLKLQNVGDI